PVAGAYSQTARLAYAGTAPVNAVYPSGRVTTGMPVFVELVHRLTLTLDYVLSSHLPHALAGDARLQAVIDDGNGWKRSVPLGGVVPLRSDRARVQATLDIDGLRRLVERFEQLSGAPAGVYTVTVTALVHARGRLGEAPIAASLRLPVAFQLD